MLNPFASQYFENSHEYDFQIKEKRTMFKIVLVKADLDRNREFISPVNLGPAG
jgi:hypothetical protein